MDMADPQAVADADQESLASMQKVQQALKDCNPDRLALKARIDKALQDLWTDALVALEEALPHERGDGSANERLFKALRHRVLTTGNNQKRDLEHQLGCFVIWQALEHQVVQRIVLKGEGPWQLPPGVRMRGQD